jgi:hypothetical protein
MSQEMRQEIENATNAYRLEVQQQQTLQGDHISNPIPDGPTDDDSTQTQLNNYENTFKQLIPTIIKAAESKTKLSFSINNIKQKIADTEHRITNKTFPTPLLNMFKTSPIELQERLIITILQDQLTRHRSKRDHLTETLSSLDDIISIIKNQINLSIHDQLLKTHQLFIIDSLTARIKQFFNDTCMALSMEFKHKMDQHLLKKEKKRLQATSQMDFHQPSDLERKIKKLEQQIQQLKKPSQKSNKNKNKNQKNGRPPRGNSNKGSLQQKKTTTV